VHFAVGNGADEAAARVGEIGVVEEVEAGAGAPVCIERCRFCRLHADLLKECTDDSGIVHAARARVPLGGSRCSGHSRSPRPIPPRPPLRQDASASRDVMRPLPATRRARLPRHDASVRQHASWPTDA